MFRTKRTHEEKNESTSVDKTATSSSGLCLTKKIQLPQNMIPLPVGMYEQPGKVVVLEPSDSVFLYTDGIGPCIGVLMFCRLQSGKCIIGVSHISIEYKINNADAVRELSQQEGGIKKAIKLGLFNPYKLNNILRGFKSQIGSFSTMGNDKIEIYFAGGKFDRQKILYELYCEYARNLENVEFKGCVFNPFGLTDEISKNLNLSDFKCISLVAGITSSGQPILAKTIDISFDKDASKFPNREALDKYFSDNNIVINNNPIRPDEVILGFESLTLSQALESRNAFTINGGSHEYAYYKVNQDYILAHQTTCKKRSR